MKKKKNRPAFLESLRVWDSIEVGPVNVEPGQIRASYTVRAGSREEETEHICKSVRPELVNMDRAVKSIPRFSNRYLDFTSKRGVSWYVRTKKISESGIIGDPTAATREKGDRFWAIMIAHLVTLVEDLKSMTLDEIYQKRY